MSKAMTAFLQDEIKQIKDRKPTIKEIKLNGLD